MSIDFKFGSYGYIAKRNLCSAERAYQYDADVTAFYSQQAIEKILKQYLQLTYYKPDAYRFLRTCDLYMLFCKVNIAELIRFEQNIADANWYYSNCRYPGIGYEEVTPKKAKELFTAARNIVAIVESKIEKLQQEPSKDTGLQNLKLF